MGNVNYDVKKTIMKIINVFETGKPDGDYGALVVLNDGAGISFGRSQVTDGANSLDLLIDDYIDAGGLYADEFRPYTDRLANKALPLTNDDQFKQLLKRSASDPIMRAVQDEFFDSRYWDPSYLKSSDLGLTEPLSFAVVYDSYIHSGGLPSSVRRSFPESPPSKGGDERAWVTGYVKARKLWLLNSSKPVVRKTVYRMETFEGLISMGNWNLILPLTVKLGRGSVKIS